MSVAFIFFGAGCGSLMILLLWRKSKAVFDPKRHLRKEDAGKFIAIVILSLLSFGIEIIGIQMVPGGEASILQNVITISTVLLAALLLREKISGRLGIGVILIIMGSIALSVTNITALSFSPGALIIIGSCFITGLLIVTMRLLADRNPVETMILRGFVVGTIALIAALCMGEAFPDLPNAIGLMTAGFVSCGLSPMFLMYGQRYLGAAESGAIYGIYPLIAVLLALPILGEMPSPALLAALILFIPGMYFVITKAGAASSGTKEGQKERGGNEARDETAGGAPDAYTAEAAGAGASKNSHGAWKSAEQNPAVNGSPVFAGCITSLGFLLLAKIFITAFICGYSEVSFFTVMNAQFPPGIFDAVLLVFIGLILLFSGQNRVQALYFTGFGAALLICLHLPAAGECIPVILLLILGIIHVLQRSLPLLPSFLLAGGAFAALLCSHLTAVPEIQTTMLLLTAGCAAVALYLAAAVFAEKRKLPVF